MKGYQAFGLVEVGGGVDIEFAVGEWDGRCGAEEVAGAGVAGELRELREEGCGDVGWDAVAAGVGRRGKVARGGERA